MSLLRRWSDYRRDTRGSAAVEFALWLAAMAVPTIGAVDVGFYGFQALQVHNAAQMAAQAAWATCALSTQQPATANCVGLNTAIQNGERSTPLQSGVKMSSGSEKWMCTNAQGKLVDVATTDGSIHVKSGDVDTSGGDTGPNPGGAPSCTYGPSGTAAAGDYIVVTVQYTYKPAFAGLSVIKFLNGGSATITQTAWTRIA